MQQNQEYIPNVLAVFLGDSGMGHPDEASSHVLTYFMLNSQLYAKPSQACPWSQLTA